MNFTFTKFKPELIPQMNALIDTYRRTYPKVTVQPAESYFAPWTEGGKNVICALDETRKLCGFAPVSFADVPDKPHTFWTAMRIHPELTFPRELQNALLVKIKDRALEITRTLAPRKCRIAFQYHQSETMNIDHAVSEGGTYVESEFLMKRDLSQKITVLPLPSGIEIRHSEMTEEDEQQKFLAVRNKAFVEGRPHQLANSVISIENFRALVHHVYQPNGIFIMAYSEQKIIGGSICYWNEDTYGDDSEKTGITDDVFVVEEWRRKGIGSYLIVKGLKYFKKCGLEYAQLGVNSANKRALHLYEKQGYIIVEENPFYIISLA